MQLNVLNIANCMRGSNESAAQCFSSLSRHQLAKPTGYILISIEKVAMAVCYISLPFHFFFFFFLRITHVQQRKDNLTAQANDTAARQRALEEEAAGVELALGNITSSLHQLALTDASPSPGPGQTQLHQTHPISHTTEVSLDSTCGTLMECEVLLCNIIESFCLVGAGLIAARI